jgi:type I restriction enzyme S subunit
MGGSKVIHTTKEGITEAAIDACNMRLVSPGTVLFSFKLSIGKVGIASVPLFTNEAIASLPILDPRILCEGFLIHALEKVSQKLVGDRAAMGMTLNKGSLAEIQIPLPPLEEQRRIAAILDKVDQLLGQSRLLIKEVLSVEQSIFESLFGEFVNGSSVYPVKALEEIVKGNRIGLVRASNECGSDLPYAYLKMDAIGKNGRLLVHKAIKTSASPEELADYSVRDGDVLFNTRNSRELVGKTAVYRGADEMLFNNNIMRIRFSPNTISPDFFRLFLSSRQGSSELESRKSGTTSVCAIYWKNLKTMPVPMPPYELQIRLAKSLECLESLSKKYFQQEMRCNDLARVLREQLVSGRN